MSNDIQDVVVLTRREAQDILDVMTGLPGESLVKYLFAWKQKNQFNLEDVGIDQRNADVLRGENRVLRKLMEAPDRLRQAIGAAVDGAE